VKDFQAMNSLKDQFGSTLNVLGVFCNQFGHQTNEENGDIANTLKHVRPGNNFESKADLFGKVHVNGSEAHPLFIFLRKALPLPCDPEDVDSKGNGCDDRDALALPRGGFNGTCVVPWSPVTRNDIAWNFEKFLLDKEGKPVARYSRYFDTINIAADVQSLIEGKAQ